MRERRDLALMSRLLVVQRARRLGTEAALAAASAAEQRACREEGEAREQSATAEQQWLAHIVEAGFSPEYGSALSARLIEREREVDRTAEVSLRKREVRVQREAAWQLSEAQVRQAEGSTRRLRRKVARRDDERRLAELGDRVTFSWSRS